MAIRTILLSFVTLTILGWSLSMTGCAASGRQRAEAKVASIQEVRNELEEAKKQIDVTVQSLEGVVAGADGDLRSTYDKYVEELSNLESQREVVRSRAEAMRAHAEEYFQAWEQDMQAVQNPELLKKAEERRAAARSRFEKIQAAADTAKESYEPFWADLQDIKKYLDVDLNPDGVAAVAEFVEKAKKSSGAVKESIDGLIAELDAVIQAMQAKKQA